MLCQVCSKNPATVHVTEILERDEPAPTDPDAPASSSVSPDAADVPEEVVEHKHICEECAERMKLPFMPVPKKSMADIWKLLQQSAQQSARLAKRESGRSCEQCGMTWGDFQAKGRIGCSSCYETFGERINTILLRIHNASEHVGRLPGVATGERQVQRRIERLKVQLEDAIRKEAYEAAAELRDELQTLEAGGA